jgi:DNA invertase Pin-like site-specific DNA recombinase
MLAMLAAVAEMEKDLIVERTEAGLARAKAEGKPAKTKPEQSEAIVNGYASKQNVSALTKFHSISLATVLTIVNSKQGKCADLASV